ncbi:hypothetical protein EZ449_06520 [Pedobacter frigidisoli]|uniref:Uncharacterized protein n=1 Tax=Pedobacter frigidisoli TaxID=2530455 RepID=A0A4R0P2U8_9SPHI|nr:hypothetical protein [Pedobacter frigidisoli]TCD11144.1 hypothetical protein EZ449_06520 [Pedobacter frigidisoli]
MKLIKLLFLGMFAILCTATKQHSNISIAQAFINDVAKGEIQNEAIIKKYLCEITESKEIELIEMQLNALRTELITGKLKIESYKNISLSEQTILVESSEKDFIYSVKCSDKFICFILLENNKIASFATINKGGRRIFISFCNQGKKI